MRFAPLPLAALALAALAGTAAGAALPDPGVPQSCGMQLKSNNFNIETLDRVHAAGFAIVRRGFYWSAVEKQKGTYDFSDYDAQMAHAKTLGLKVVGTLFSDNKAYEDDGLGGIQTEAGRQGFAAFAAALATHYRDYDIVWEIWNEPNVRTFWRKNGTHNSEPFADEYTALVKAVVPAMRAAVPECIVLAGSVSNYWEPSYQWTEFCFKKGILESGISSWSVHPYGVKTPEEFAIGHGRTRALLKQYGHPDLPLATERGFSAEETAEGWSGGSKERATDFQSWNLVRQFMVDQLHGVRLTIWYQWEGEGFGLVNGTNDLPAMAAARTMLQELNGYKLVRRLDASSGLDYVLLWQNPAGARKLVAWTAPPPGGSPDETRNHDVTIATSGAAAQPIKLALSGAPQYVALPAGVEPGACTAPAGLGEPAPAAPAPMPVGAKDLNLFDKGTAWTFTPNTGTGSFTLDKDADGKPIGVLTYDFTASTANSTPYVIASVPVAIIEGTMGFLIHVRTPIAQRITVRLIDSTGQTHQSKHRIKGTGAWEVCRVPLNGRLEHWGGANDGKRHYPLTGLSISVPLPGEANKTGKVEFADASTE